MFVLLASVSQVASFWVSKDTLGKAFREQEIEKIKSVGGVIERMIGLQVERVHEVAEILSISGTLPDFSYCLDPRGIKQSPLILIKFSL